jgi:hypothetical protein
MEEFTQWFNKLLALFTNVSTVSSFMGISGGLSRPEQAVYFVRQILGIPVVGKEVLSQRTREYQKVGGRLQRRGWRCA